MDMKEAKGLNHVARFHRTFNLPVLEAPQIPDEKRCRLRINLLREELAELEKAIDDKDMTEVADALCDLQYVLSGAILEFGLGEAFSDLFDEVQRSNMSKVCNNREEAEATLAYYRSERNTEGYIVESEGEYLVYRTSDKKVLKSINYSPARLKERLEKWQKEKATL